MSYQLRSRSRSRSRHNQRISKRYYNDNGKRRRSYSFEQNDNNKLRKKRYNNNNNNNHNNHNTNNYYQQNNNNRNYYYYHNHNHYHYHHHHHHYNDNNHNNNNNKDKKGTDNNNNNNDLEGTVNLKNITTIYRSRYSIGKKLGQGTFGLVIECIDNKRKIRVAVKIVRSVRRYLDAAEIEVEILNKLDKFDIYKNSLIIRLYKSFRCLINNVEHSCLVFEKCGRSLYDYIKKNKYNGFPLFIIAIIGYQLFHSISFCHFNKLTHTDLKLENILFVCDQIKYNNRYNLHLPKNNNFEIRLIDFGGATFENDHHSSIINTRQYRGPEVILSLSWSYPSDIWSIGCILAELYQGELLFATHNDYEHIQLIQKILNKQFPKYMINNNNIKLFKNNKNNKKNKKKKSSSSRSSSHCSSSSSSSSCSSSSSSSSSNNNVNNKYVEKCKKLKQIIKNQQLFDLINKCLEIDPKKRITATQAKNHPFFEQFKNNSTHVENVQFNKIFNMINNNHR